MPSTVKIRSDFTPSELRELAVGSRPAKQTVVVKGASHVVMVSRPRIVAKSIGSAVAAE